MSKHFMCPTGISLLIWGWFVLSGMAAEPVSPSQRPSSGQEEGAAPVQEEGGSEPVDCPEDYIRLVQADRGTIHALQTSIHSLSGSVDGNPVTVDLVGVVHFGDKKYYAELNERFKQYDVVLYELVLPRNAVPKPGTQLEISRERNGKITSPLAVIALVQEWFGTSLGLASQMEEINYKASNFVHADMDAETFVAEVMRKGEVLDFMYRSAIDSMADQDSTGSAALVSLLFAKNRQNVLRRVTARQLASSFETSPASVEESTMIGDRNRIALARLNEQVHAGQKKLAIFYGLAHLPDFRARLANDYGLTTTDVQWLTAWEM